MTSPEADLIPDDKNADSNIYNRPTHIFPNDWYEWVNLSSVDPAMTKVFSKKFSSEFFVFKKVTS